MNSPHRLMQLFRGAALALACLFTQLTAQPLPMTNPEILSQFWSASWISHPSASLTDYGVFLFRKPISLDKVPSSFVIHVSADNRYRLLINGNSVGVGPARGDLNHWRFETIDIAAHLKPGANVLAAVVWNFGEQRPVAQMSLRTAFILQGNSKAESTVNTDASWKVIRNDAISALPLDMEKLRTYIVIGPGDLVDGKQYPWGWQALGFNDSDWAKPRLLGKGMPYGTGTGSDLWLVPRNIPAVEEQPQRFASVRRCEGVSAGADFIAGKAPLSIPARSKAKVLVDQSFETTGYPQLLVSGGAGATLTLSYAEALFDKTGAKDNRNDIEGRELIGTSDRFLPDGGLQRLFSTLRYRTYRYVELSVETAAQPLLIHDFHGVFTAYPFKEHGSFSSDDPVLTDIWNVGWRTARLCAFETYMDCPYYEQLQYVGDTRIQALISLAVSGDDRLMRNAIDLYDKSRIAEGLTQSRYPSASPQIINTFSLFWIDMVHDYWMHRDDADFVREQLMGMRSVLDWFEKRIDPATGMLKGLPYWTFVDWPDEWAWNEALAMGGQPKGAVEGGSSIVTLQLACTLERAADLFQAFGKSGEAEHCRSLAKSLCAATLKQCWDEKRRLVSDTPAKTDFSQHANIMAVLSGAVDKEKARELIGRVSQDTSIIQCTQYFRFYLLRAMKQAGLGDRYVSMLQPWRTMVAKGLSTFAERQDPTRSDCHAWSASPNYELLATVCGIEPASPGFKTVKIEPHPGPLTRIEGSLPHPSGLISVHLQRNGDRIHGTVTLPGALSGNFHWKGRTITLHGGEQTVDL